MSANVAHDARIPDPPPTDTQTASTVVGACHLCRRGILRGQRYSRLFPSGRIAHVVCVAGEAGTDTRRAA